VESNEHAAFAREVEASQLQDPMPAFEGLSKLTGIPTETLVRHALVRWTREGAESLMLIEPQVLHRLFAARKRENWPTVAGIIDWLESGISPSTEARGPADTRDA
jgi:hypothetical protein